jgi:hypothetical protein
LNDSANGKIIGNRYMYLPTRYQVALGNVEIITCRGGFQTRYITNPVLRLIIIFIVRNNTRPVGGSGRVGLPRAAGIEAVAGAFLLALIPESAALPDAMAHSGEGADDGGVVSQHILRRWRVVPALRLSKAYFVNSHGREVFDNHFNQGIATIV